MQDAVGSPLPPPHQPGQGPTADRPSAAAHGGQQHLVLNPGPNPDLNSGRNPGVIAGSVSSG
uniref:Pro-rich N-terminal domain-containing protein n=1 Tax=Streptomyces graminilatus TaxID=1464070 RepID=UPI001F51C1FB